MLSVLGLQPAEEELYRRLVTHVRLSAADAASMTGRSLDEVAGIIGRLVARGLVAADTAAGTPGPDTVFRATPPAVALGGLLQQRHDELRAAERELAAIVDEHRVAAAGRTTGSAVEEITDADAVRHRFVQIQQAARHEVLAMMRPNLTVVPHRQNAAGEAGLGRGVRYRAILDRKALAQPGMAGDVLCSIEAGQEIRIADDVPVKLVIVDREQALVPLLPSPNRTPESVLVRSSGLLDALIAYFDLAWQRSYPLLPNAGRAPLGEPRPEIDAVDARILGLLLSGMTEESVAGQLGTSRRTVQRRIRELMRKANADTRIELGWYAARHGWA